MESKRLGTQTVKFKIPPAIVGHGNVVGKKEGEGPLRDSFDSIDTDTMFARKTWEQAESEMQRRAFATAIEKAAVSPSELHYIFGGDLLNQCVATSFHLKNSGVPFFGLYGACSTMAESLALAAMAIDGGYALRAAAVTSSHFSTAERQYRTPLSYGSQRTPSAQWTVTAAGAVVLAAGGPPPYVKAHTTGCIVDMEIKDANNMGAAMAPAAYDTLTAFFADTGLKPTDLDLIVTGDLGKVGASVLRELFKMDKVDLGPNYNDCGLMIYDLKAQDVHAGGSGCGCSAAVLTGHILNSMRAGKYDRVLFAATGALHSPTVLQQGGTIPGICHAVLIENFKEERYALDLC